MSLAEVVSAHAGDDRAVVFHPSAARQVARIPRVQPLGENGSPDGAVVLLRAASGSEVAAVADLAELIGDRGIGVLALEAPARDLPLGALLSALGEAGVRVLRAEEVPATEVESVLVVTRDPSQLIRSYLMGEAVDTRDVRTAARRDNELQVEGLVRRAVAVSAEQLARSEADQSRARLDEAEAQLQKALARAVAAESELRRRDALTLGYRAQRLSRNLRSAPLKTSARTLRRLSRRADGS